MTEPSKSPSRTSAEQHSRPSDGSANLNSALPYTTVPTDALYEAVEVLRVHLDEWTGTAQQRRALVTLRALLSQNDPQGPS